MTLMTHCRHWSGFGLRDAFTGTLSATDNLDRTLRIFGPQQFGGKRRLITVSVMSLEDSSSPGRKRRLSLVDLDADISSRPRKKPTA